VPAENSFDAEDIRETQGTRALCEWGVVWVSRLGEWASSTMEQRASVRFRNQSQQDLTLSLCRSFSAARSHG